MHGRMSYSLNERYELARYAIKGAYKHDPSHALTHFREHPRLLLRRKGSLLHLMIEEDRWSLLESVLKENPTLIWHQNHKQMSLLYFAVLLRKYDIAFSLIKLQPGLTQMICKNLKTPLHLASDDDTHLMNALIPYVGSAIAAVTKDRRGCTPLHYYVRYWLNNRWIQTFLYLSMAPLSMKNDAGQTPYEIAIENTSPNASFLSLFEDQRNILIPAQPSLQMVKKNRFCFYFQRSLTAQLLDMISDVPESVLKAFQQKK